HGIASRSAFPISIDERLSDIFYKEGRQ
ncbi:hypothetical protein LINPERPRIM_LOCUS13319, partial [Linum perenne]